MSIFEGVIEFLGSNKATDMSHVSQEIGTDLITNGSVALVIEVSWVSRETSNDDLGLKFSCGLFKGIVINVPGLGIYIILL